MALIYSDRAMSKKMLPARQKPAVTPAKEVLPSKKTLAKAPKVPKPTKADPNQIDISDFNVEAPVVPGKTKGSSGNKTATINNRYKTQKDYTDALVSQAQEEALKELLAPYLDEETGEQTLGMWYDPYRSLLGNLQSFREDEEDALSKQYVTAGDRLRSLYGLTPTKFFEQLKDEGDELTPEQRRAQFLAMARRRGTTPSAMNPPTDGETPEGEAPAPDSVSLDDWLSTAQGQTYLGYENLKDWLSQNAPKAYAEAARATSAPMTNALQAYQRAQGVSSAPSDAAVALANLAGEGGAANYNNLLNVLQAAERSQGASRMAEAEFAQNIGANRLNAALTGGLGGLTQQEAAALAGIASRYGQRGMDIETTAVGRFNTLMDKLASLAGYADVADYLKKLGVK